MVAKKGSSYGFIDSAELRTMYGRDVMFIPSMVGGKEVFNEMEVGTAVRFSVKFENGQPKACEVSFPGRSMPPRGNRGGVGLLRADKRGMAPLARALLRGEVNNFE